MQKTALQTYLDAHGLRLIDLSKKMGVDKSSVTRWSKNRIPAERVLDVERTTGISRHLLRPDIYPGHEGEAA